MIQGCHCALSDWQVRMKGPSGDSVGAAGPELERASLVLGSVRCAEPGRGRAHKDALLW
jgi:hypothetical protein